MCQILAVSRSGYYEWIERLDSRKKVANINLLKEIKRVYDRSRGIYGRIRITKKLNSEGIKCSQNRVYRLMKENNIFSKMKRKFKATTNSKHNHAVAPNLLNQDFATNKPCKKWVSDITYIPTKEGWLYLAAVLDLYDKKIIGWAMDSTMNQELVIKAFQNAVRRRKPEEGLIHHSDRGSQFASKAYQNLLKKHNITVSMSRKGNCYDNACMESFFGTLKTELIYFCSYRSRQEAKSSIFEYIEIFYNNERLHSSLGYRSPNDYGKSVI